MDSALLKPILDKYIKRCDLPLFFNEYILNIILHDPPQSAQHLSSILLPFLMNKLDAAEANKSID